jgi:hypothetical protein
MDDFYDYLVAALESIGNAMAETSDTISLRKLETAFNMVEDVVIADYGESPFAD